VAVVEKEDEKLAVEPKRTIIGVSIIGRLGITYRGLSPEALAPV